MTGFGGFDHDPEDAYDAGDPPGQRLRIIERVVDALRASSDRRGPRREDALRLLDNLEHEPGVDLLHVHQLRADLQAL
jgi:hypothetical protein